ncbi:MAG: hypothetical protein NC405_01970 [Odoribacter sp.]|nr:hypothetical protein [Odoribacter sp.]
MMKASEFFSLAASSAKALVKIGLKSRRLQPVTPAPTSDVVILANGPSLRHTLTERGHELSGRTTICVNFMANTPEMQLIKPAYYVLADPHFFHGLEHENVAEVWRNIAHASWPLTLCVPATNYKDARRLLGQNTRIRIATFNFVGIEGFKCIENYAFSHGIAMPRPRNVLIPAIMVALAAGFKHIFIAGADHSWMETIRVDDDNNVVSVQPHFYNDSKAETARSTAEYRGYRLHQIIHSFYIAFRSYHSIARYAASHGISIYNSTPGSYIDAFERRDF